MSTLRGPLVSLILLTVALGPQVISVYLSVWSGNGMYSHMDMLGRFPNLWALCAIASKL